MQSLLTGDDDMMIMINNQLNFVNSELCIKQDTQWIYSFF